MHDLSMLCLCRAFTPVYLFIYLFIHLSISCAMDVCATPSIVVLVLLSCGSCGLCVVLVALDRAFELVGGS